MKKEKGFKPSRTDRKQILQKAHKAPNSEAFVSLGDSPAGAGSISLANRLHLTTRRTVALILILVLLLTVIPLSILFPKADDLYSTDYDGPALNETVVGTVKFQSFNFLGRNAEGDDGVDYEATYYYTDDYFAHSAINEKLAEIDSASDKIQQEYNEKHRVPWTYLEDTSLATCSMDLAVSAYATGAHDVEGPSTKTWANTDYSDRAANAREFLTNCGFEKFKAVDYEHAPDRKGIAYVLASKTIHVWDEETQQNKDYTLVAVGVRGAGYGAEWASNVEIGTPGSGASNIRHEGFDSSAKIVCEGIKQYLKDNNITSETNDVKFWVSGFSRAAAVANLTAGYLTEYADQYDTQQKHVYGYTWECPQGASKTKDDALSYSNIHNIVNAMDVVPMVSPSVFNHQRLGVDYIMPYYGNTITKENTEYYNRMYNVLKTIAVGTTYQSDGTTAIDPLIDAVNPANYPYNRPVPIYTITADQLISDAFSGTKVLMKNFGTVKTSGTENKIGTNLYMDQFLDSVLRVCLASGAWDRYYSTSKTDMTDPNTYLLHKERYINKYQASFQDAFAYFLDFAGPAYMDMITAVTGAIGSQLSLSNTASNAGVGLAFINFYRYPTANYDVTLGILKPSWIGKVSWTGKSRKEVLIAEAQPVVKNVVHNMVADYENDKKITRPVSLTDLDKALDLIVEVVIDLYADELSNYNSNYFGTTLHYLNEILSTHEQETVLSWITSLDPNHINRSYRTLTVPADSKVTLYEFRDQYAKYSDTIDETLSPDNSAPVVATFENGKQLDSLDQRIYSVTNNNGTLTIRYPASLNLRADITTLNGANFDDLNYQVNDYTTTTETQDISVGKEQYERIGVVKDVYNDITNNETLTNAKTINDDAANGTDFVSAFDTYQVLVNGSSTYNNATAEDKQVYSTNKKVQVTWQNDDGSILKQEQVNVGDTPVYTGETPTKEAPSKMEYVFQGWAPDIDSLTEDQTYVAQFSDLQERLRVAHNLTLEGDIGVNFYYYIPDRYDGTLNVTFTYRGNEIDGNLSPTTDYGYNYKASYRVAAKEMTESISATLTSDDTLLNEHTYSIAKYINLVIANPSSVNPTLIPLVKSMAYYGSCAQLYFKYNTADLANKGIDYIAPELDPETIPIADFDKDTVNTQLAQYGLEYRASNLTLESNTTLRLYFLSNGQDASDIEIKVNGKPTNFTSRTWNGTDYLCIEVPNIPAKNLGDVQSITIGDVAFHYSVFNYVKNTLKSDASQELKDTVTALYDYNIKAVEYFNSKK